MDPVKTQTGLVGYVTHLDPNIHLYLFSELIRSGTSIDNLGKLFWVNIYQDENALMKPPKAMPCYSLT